MGQETMCSINHFIHSGSERSRRSSDKRSTSTAFPVVPMRKLSQIAGATILEGIVAAAILVVGLAGVFATFGRTVNVVRAGKSASVAQQNSNARLDQLRNVGWAKVTDPTYIATLLSTPIPSSSENLQVTKEVISVYPAAVPLTLPTPSPTPSPTAVSTTPYFTVTRTGNSAPVISPAGFDASATLASTQLNYRVLTEWQIAGKTHQRELATILSRSATR